MYAKRDDALRRHSTHATLGRESSDTYGESLAGTLKSEKYVTEDIDPYVKRGDPSSGLIPGVQDGTLSEEGQGDDRAQAYNYRLCLTQRDGSKVDFTKPEGYRASDYGAKRRGQTKTHKL